MSEDGVTGPDDPRHEPRAPADEPAARVIVLNAEARPGGDVRAGWLVAQMDLAASSVAVRHSRERCATVAIDAIAFPVPIRLGDADPADLAEIEVTPGGIGLHWPRLDEDVYVPGLRAGVYGTKRWMAALVEAETARLDAIDRIDREKD